MQRQETDFSQGDVVYKDYFIPAGTVIVGNTWYDIPVRHRKVLTFDQGTAL